MPTVAKSTAQRSLISSQTMSPDRGSCCWPPTVNDLQWRAFCRRGGVERCGRGLIQVDNHGFKCGAPAFVIRALRVLGDLGHQPVAKLVPWQAKRVDEGERDRQSACLPRRFEDELAVVAGQRFVVK